MNPDHVPNIEWVTSHDVDADERDVRRLWRNDELMRMFRQLVVDGQEVAMALASARRLTKTSHGKSPAALRGDAAP